MKLDPNNWVGFKKNEVLDLPTREIHVKLEKPGAVSVVNKETGEITLARYGAEVKFTMATDIGYGVVCSEAGVVFERSDALVECVGVILTNESKRPVMSELERRIVLRQRQAEQRERMKRAKAEEEMRRLRAARGEDEEDPDDNQEDLEEVEEGEEEVDGDGKT